MDLAAVVMSLGVGVIGVTLQSYSVAWSSHTSLGGLKFRLGGPTGSATNVCGNINDLKL